MGTGLEAVAFRSKRILGLQDFRDRIAGRAETLITELFALTYSQGGVYFDVIAMTADGADKFKIDTGKDTTDGAGHILTPDVELAEDVQFENTNAIVYSVGLHYAQRPRGIQNNPRDGFPEIVRFEDTVGEQADPDSVIDLGGTLEMIVDSVTEVAVSNAGRTAIVWKKVPGKNGITELVAIESLTVTWDGFNNKVTTAGVFGQVGTPSTVAADYQVTVIGPTVSRNTNLSVTPGYAFIGDVTGAGPGNPPVTFSIVNQNKIDTTFTGLDDITRIGTNGDLKISVDADVLDSGENQIEVLDAPGGSVVFFVDEAGNVRIEGNLIVVGTETVQSVETVTTNQIIGDNLIAGDVDGDSHTFRGTVTHTSTGFGGTSWSIDGATGVTTYVADVLISSTSELTVQAGGQVAIESGAQLTVDSGGVITVLDVGGININPNAGGALIVNFGSFIDVRSLASILLNSGSEITVNGGGEIVFNSGAFLQMDAGAEVQGNLIPDTNNSATIGDPTNKWSEGHFAQFVRIDRSAGEGTAAVIFAEGVTDQLQWETRFGGAGATGNFLGLRSPGAGVQAAGEYSILVRTDGAVAVGTEAVEADAFLPLSVVGDDGNTSLNDPSSSVRLRIVNKNTTTDTKAALQLATDGATDDGGYIFKGDDDSNGMHFGIETGAVYQHHVSMFGDGNIYFGGDPEIKFSDTVGDFRFSFIGGPDVGINSWRDNTISIGRYPGAGNGEVGYSWHQADTMGLGEFWWVGLNETIEDLTWHYFEDTAGPFNAASVPGGVLMRLHQPPVADGTPTNAFGLAITAGRGVIQPGAADETCSRHQNNAIVAYGTVDSTGAIQNSSRRWNYGSSVRNSIGNYTITFGRNLISDYAIYLTTQIASTPTNARVSAIGATGFTFLTDETNGNSSPIDADTSFMCIGVDAATP